MRHPATPWWSRPLVSLIFVLILLLSACALNTNATSTPDQGNNGGGGGGSTPTPQQATTCRNISRLWERTVSDSWSRLWRCLVPAEFDQHLDCHIRWRRGSLCHQTIRCLYASQHDEQRLLVLRQRATQRRLEWRINLSV